MASGGAGAEEEAVGASTPIRIPNHLLKAVDSFVASNGLFGSRREVIQTAIREFLERQRPSP